MTEPDTTITEWQQYVSYVNDLRDSSGRTVRWVFRGQRDASWDLVTSIDRSLGRFNTPLLERREAEAFLVREFKRHYHRYSEYIPRDEDMIEWLGLMQHHGAPTRLLDWTYSAYVALYFAVESSEEGATASVWMINQTACWNRFKTMLSPKMRRSLENDDKDLMVINSVLQKFSEPMICPLNPLYLNARLSIQQGNFLVPLGADLTFTKNFEASISPNKSLWRKVNVICNDFFLASALTELQRMNITETNLFPGVDGLARSLRTTVLLPHLLPQR